MSQIPIMGMRKQRGSNMPKATQSKYYAGLDPWRVFSSSPGGPLTNIALGSHPEHLFGLHVLQLAQARWVY